MPLRARFRAEGLESYVSACMEAREKGLARLRFSIRIGETMEANTGILASPGSWVSPAVFQRSAEVAFSWLCGADALFLETLIRNDSCTLTITSESRVAGSYSGGRLIAPLFLAEPDLSPLYPFQREGVKWLLEGKSRVLADDMGLGKTIQVIFAIRQLVTAGLCRSSLVVCPKALVRNWVGEFRKWAPELLVSQIQTVFGMNFKKATLTNHVVVSHYEQLRKSDGEQRGSEVDVLVADEAHRLRNEESQISGGFKGVSRERTWLLTGTPLERDLADVATLLALTDPLRFSLDDARLPAETLKTRAEPYVLRRTKETVLNDLPDVTDTTEYLDFLPKQRESYMRALSRRATTSNALTLLNRLRSICDIDPESKESAKVRRTTEIVVDVIGRGEKIIVFSYLLEPLRVLNREIGERVGRKNSIFFDGSLGSEERHAAVRRFSDRGGPSVFLASTKVTGEGLTLTAANHVVFLNQWWNPSANDQARDRVVRIGQSKDCYIYRLMMKESVEEALERILLRKGLLVKEVVGGLTRAASKGPQISPNLALEVLEESCSIVNGKLKGDTNKTRAR